MLAIYPDHAEVLLTQAQAYRGLALDDLCLTTLAKITAPTVAAYVLVVRGYVLWDQGRSDEARHAAAAACQIAGPGASRVAVKAQLARLKFRDDSADEPTTLEVLEQIVRDAMNNAEARAERANELLRQGFYVEGWREYARRWNSPLARYGVGECAPQIGGQTVIIRAEQGYGDMINYCRYAKILADAGAMVRLEAYPHLRTLLSTLDERVEIVEVGWKAPQPAMDIRLMDVPALLSTTTTKIPAWPSYLSADPAAVTWWAHHLGPARRPRVGLVWAGGTRPGLDRTLPAVKGRDIGFRAFSPLLHADVDFVSLQIGSTAEAELVAFNIGRAERAVGDHGANIKSFADTAALIANLDLVIAVDTSTAHLAGALGKPVWLLNRWRGCSRWGSGSDTTPWYPSMRIFTQRTPGDWEGVVKEVGAALKAFVQKAGRAPADPRPLPRHSGQ